LEGLASVLEADLSTYKLKILKILSDCAIRLPDKCTIYTTLIGLLNTKNYNFGGEVRHFFDEGLIFGISNIGNTTSEQK
jgi:nuclear cap-binding protein subunit 1